MIQTEKKELDYARYYQKWHTDKPEHINAMKYLYNRMLENHLPNKKIFLSWMLGVEWVLQCLH